MAGFEPATSSSQNWRDDRTTLHPEYLPQFFCGERGIRTPGTRYRYDSLANCWFQPLTHLSNSFQNWSCKITTIFITTKFIDTFLFVFVFILTEKSIMYSYAFFVLIRIYATKRRSKSYCSCNFNVPKNRLWIISTKFITIILFCSTI